MDDGDYIREAMRTDANDYTEQASRLALMAPLIHGAMGLCTESAELLDAIKKHVYYGKQLDVVNLWEELGDMLWYIALICDEMNFNLGEIKQRNIEKLRARYPEKFSQACAISRNLEKERSILEGK